MKFSERNGYKEVSKVLQVNEVSENLKNLLWNGLYVFIWDEGTLESNYNEFMTYLWHFYFKEPLDKSKHYRYYDFIQKIRNYYFEAKWYELYDFLEEILNYFKNESLNEFINNILEEELSGYRFISGQITDITDKREVEMLEIALNDTNFSHVRAHLQRALELLSDRKKPDYRNSIKESISAVESIAKEISQKPKAELGEASKEIEKQGKLHGAMKSAFLSLYGYTSDANGIRHALMEESNLTADDAKFFLLSCTSFINYLKAKM